MEDHFPIEAPYGTIPHPKSSGVESCFTQNGRFRTGSVFPNISKPFLLVEVVERNDDRNKMKHNNDDDDDYINKLLRLLHLLGYS